MRAKIAIFLVLTTFFLVISSFDQAESQVVYLPDDTMKVLDINGAPGDSVFLTIHCANTINVSALTLRLVFDSTLVKPRMHGNMVNAYRTYRTPITTYPMFQGGCPECSVLTFFASTDLYPEPDDTITYMPPGSGPIVQFVFGIDSNLTEDTVATIRFEEDPTAPWTWNTFSDPAGIITYIPITVDGMIHISTGPINHPPEFGALASQFEVTEGDSLGFLVSASDPDGDSLSLYVETSLPPNASFPTKEGEGSVSQWFVFKPDFTQGPDVFNVTFAAQDTPGAVTRKTVTITVHDFEVSGDILVVSKYQGGVPGAKERLVSIELNNSNEVYGVQFDLEWNANIMQIDSFIKTDRTSTFSLRTNLGDSSGIVTVLLFGLENQKIIVGTGPILYFSASVDSLSECGLDVPLVLSDAKEAIYLGGPSQPLVTTDGLFYVDCFGDVNSDRNIDIADVVDLVAYILGNIDFDQRQWEAADVNHDSTVDVGDLVGVINIILGRPIEGAPLGGFIAPLASVELDLEDLKEGYNGDARIWADLLVPVAGAQFEIEYDPDQLSFSTPILTERTDGFVVQYKDDKNGKLKVVMYSLTGEAIQPGKGNILSLPAEANPNLSEELKIDLTDVVLANPGAVVIPVSGYSNLPKRFSLSQNYPNPFNPQTTIQYEIGGDDPGMQVHATLKIYNILGQQVRTLVNEDKSPGIYKVVWDGRDESGDRVSSGVYLYRLTMGEYSETKKMVLMK